MMTRTEVNRLQPKTDGANLVVAGSRAAWLHDGKVEICDLAKPPVVRTAPSASSRAGRE